MSYADSEARNRRRRRIYELLDGPRARRTQTVCAMGQHGALFKGVLYHI